MITLTREIEQAVHSKTRSIARSLIARDRERAEETVYLSMPDSIVRDKLLTTMRLVREQTELVAWNRGLVKQL